MNLANLHGTHVDSAPEPLKGVVTGNELPAVQISTSSFDISYVEVYTIAESLLVWKYSPMDDSIQTAVSGDVASGCGRLATPVLGVQSLLDVAESYRYSAILPNWSMM